MVRILVFSSEAASSLNLRALVAQMPVSTLGTMVMLLMVMVMLLMVMMMLLQVLM